MKLIVWRKNKETGILAAIEQIGFVETFRWINEGNHFEIKTSKGETILYPQAEVLDIKVES